MRSVEDHLASVLGQIGPLEPIDLPLLDAQGCLLAEDVAAGVDLPPFDNSAMDGYAVRLADLAGSSEQYPSILRVGGDVAAGDREPGRIVSGLTLRVMTGAPVPEGTEAVVPVEWTDGGVNDVRITQAPKPGQYVRRRGEDVRAGDALLAAGTLLGATQLGLLAAVGRGRVRVRPRPRVVVLSTGSELVEPGHRPPPGKINDANGFTLTAAAREAGAVATRGGTVADDKGALLDAVEDQLGRADLLVTSGGVSVGAYDLVKKVFSDLGAVSFERVAMQPGMPQGFGRVGPEQTPIFTLPGNPVSAYVSFEVFVRPAIRAMMGVRPLRRPIVPACCLDGFSSPAGRRQYVRARYAAAEAESPGTVTPVGGHGSHLLGGLAAANALIVVPEEVTEVSAGEQVEVMPLGPDEWSQR
jgi:molybdopterin molybdotransferase